MRFQILLKIAAVLSVCGTICAQTEISATDAAVKKSGIIIDAETFPDAGFRKIVKKQADTNGDGVLSKTEIQNATKLDILVRHQKGHVGYTATKKELFQHHGKYSYDGKNMDFTGIEILQNLEKIRIHNSRPLNIPFQKLKKLKIFEISSAPAVTLDVSGAPGLEKMGIASTDLNGICLDKNAALKCISIFNSNIEGKKIDFSANTDLEKIWMLDTNAVSVNLGTNDRLKDLEIRGSSLSDINLSGCRNLEFVCLSGNRLRNLDVSGNQKLRQLYVSGNLIKRMDLSSNRKLEYLFIDNNPFIKIDSSTLTVADNCGLSKLWANYLKKCRLIDVSYISSLEHMDADAGSYKKMKIGGELRSITMSSSEIKVLNAETLEAPEDAKLESLVYKSSVLEKMNLGHLKNLVHVRASDNQLEEIDLSGNPKLFHMVPLEGNPIKKLMISREITEEQKACYKRLVEKSWGEVLYQ